VRTELARCAVCGADDGMRVGSGVDFEYETCTNEFTFVRCRPCGHVYLRNRPVPAELASIYPSHYGNYSSERSHSLGFRVKSWLDGRAVAQLARRGSALRRVLDVGCADGRQLDVCARVLPQAEQLSGIEISEQAARGALAKGYAVTIGSLESLELPERAYDLIFLQQVIEHLYAPERACRALARCLAPGGLIVFETPTIECIDFELLRERYWGGYHIPRHYQLFSERSLLALCRAAGLEHLETHYTPQPIHWIWSLRHYLKERAYPAWTWRSLHIQNPLALAVGTAVELTAGLLWRRMSNLRLIARRPAA
jgi:SAM-dependent methyltransferase